MHLLMVFCVPLLVYTCDGAGQIIPLTDDQKKLSVQLHNKYRLGEHSSNMDQLIWCESCSNVAADWIKRCDFNHQMKNHGENLFYSTMVKDINGGIEEALKDWFDEKYLPQSYGGCGNRCHYTQMVWAETREVGCAAVNCPYLWAFGQAVKDAVYIACFYTPKGNTIGRPTYLSGEACSKCREGQGCEDGLCTGKGTVQVSCKDTHSSCKLWASIGECDINPRYMKKKCRKSCALCSGANNDESCMDFNPNCDEWSSVGQCKANAGYMLKNCRKSCGVC